MDLVMASAILGALRDGAELLFAGASESVSLVLWGSGLLALGAGVKWLLAPTHRLHASKSQGEVAFVSEHGSLTESRA
jgi:hypothetical protein